jgi:Protein of unknown function (DUF1634)
VTSPRRLEIAVEWVLTAGVFTSGALLLLGLSFGLEPLLRAGVLLLMLTPVARVLVLTIGLFREGDRRFAFVSFVVLAILVAGIVVAR